jgi:hypothetical protein
MSFLSSNNIGRRAQSIAVFYFRNCLQYLDAEFRFLQLEIVFLAPCLFRFFHVRYGVYLDQTLVNQLVDVLFGCHCDAQGFPCNQNSSLLTKQPLFEPQPSLEDFARLV